MMISPGDEVYEGQIVGVNSRDRDLAVNPLKGKKLTNMRASGKDDAIALTSPTRLTLEESLEFLEDDELLEVTPSFLRLRKRHLDETTRRRAFSARHRAQRRAMSSRCPDRSAGGSAACNSVTVRPISPHRGMSTGWNLPSIIRSKSTWIVRFFSEMPV